MKRMFGCGVAILVMMAGPALGQNDKPKAPGNAPAAQPGNAGKPGNAPAGQPPMDPMMEAMMKAAQPGPEHEAMKKIAGTWDAAVKMFEPGSDKAEESKGTMVNTLIHGGRYIQMDYKGEMMGGPFTGSGVWGYDNVNKQYVSTWVDNWSTGIMVMTGTYDAATKTYTSHGEMSMAMPDGTATKMKQREVVKILSDDKHVMEMYGPGPDGKEMKMMEITYTRKK